MARKNIQVDCRWVEEFVRFQHQRTGKWEHPAKQGEREVTAFLTHLAVNRRLGVFRMNNLCSSRI